MKRNLLMAVGLVLTASILFGCQNAGKNTEGQTVEEQTAETVQEVQSTEDRTTKKATDNSAKDQNDGTVTVSADGITEAEAKKIALEDAKAIVQKKLPEAKDSDIRMHLERDDGRMVYEGDVKLSGSREEYEFEIDASTGEVISWERD